MVLQLKADVPKATSPDKFTFGKGEDVILEKRNKLKEELKQQYQLFNTEVCENLSIQMTLFLHKQSLKEFMKELMIFKFKM